MSPQRDDDTLFVGVVTLSEQDRAEMMKRALGGHGEPQSLSESKRAALVITYEATLRAMEQELEELGDRADALAKAIATVNEHHDLGDAVYAIRSRYLCDWEDPRLTAYSQAVVELRALGALS